MANTAKPKIIMRNISELLPAEYNPRKLSEKQEKDIRQSLEKFGMAEPAIVNMNEYRKNIIIGGHQRIKVMEKLGHKKVPVIEVNLDLEDEKELNIRLNKNTGEWDYQILGDFFDKDLILDWGFEEIDLNNFMPTLDPEASDGVVTDQDINSKQDELDSKFDNSQDVNTLEVICPECAHEFKINA